MVHSKFLQPAEHLRDRSQDDTAACCTVLCYADASSFRQLYITPTLPLGAQYLSALAHVARMRV